MHVVYKILLCIRGDFQNMWLHAEDYILYYNTLHTNAYLG